MRFVRKTNDEFLIELKRKNIIYTPLEKYNGNNNKIKWLCYKCNNIFYSSPNNILNGRGCSYCNNNGKSILIGFNDMWTTNSKLASMLLNNKDGYKYKQNSNVKVDWICPLCKSIIYSKRISYVNKNGLSCPNCSDGISYPEKFISNMLMQLNIKFLHDTSFNWSNGKRYDFYIKDMSLIIETHGMQHYKNGFVNIGGKNHIQQNIIDYDKKNQALKNGVEKYIELDCRYSKSEYILNEIMNSELSKIFNLNDIDWNICNEYAITNSKIIDVCKIWNETKNTKYISDTLKLSRTTVIDYLKKGNNLGLCDYNSFENILNCNSKSVICIETNKIYKRINDVIQDGFNPKCVSNCCNGWQNVHKGYHFKFKGVN